MNSQALQVPEGQLLEIVQTVYQALPASAPEAVHRQRRLLATDWLRDLINTIHRWNLEFIGVLKGYPGFRDSRSPVEYAAFFDQLLAYRQQLKTRSGGIKKNLCHRLIQLNQRLDQDFAWLEQSDFNAFRTLKHSCNEAYQDEIGIIRLALALISELVEPANPPGPFTRDLRGIVGAPDFLQRQIERRDHVRQIIEKYVGKSEEIIDQIAQYSKTVDAKLLSIEDYERRESGYSPVLEDDKKMVRISNRPEVDRQMVDTRLYTILAFCFGVVFLGALLAITAFNPNPTVDQLRFWIPILAIATGAVATVISGLVNVRLSFGKQFAVGATGALAVFIIVYFKNPAIFGM
ncbi:hypothetical protein ACRQ5Q_09040 [Bradyrhizobium sp. PMVTL-01]|uniref:hypothetical protein n=1 Tax=Bradyrhizobium sp. PMVTL-01 TaxID=3434999 RepID=UPI003F72B3BA